jgi:hypothetical protein
MLVITASFLFDLIQLTIELFNEFRLQFLMRINRRHLFAALCIFYRIFFLLPFFLDYFEDFIWYLVLLLNIFYNCIDGLTLIVVTQFFLCLILNGLPHWIGKGKSIDFHIFFFRFLFLWVALSNDLSLILGVLLRFYLCYGSYIVALLQLLGSLG